MQIVNFLVVKYIYDWPANICSQSNEYMSSPEINNYVHS